MAIITKILTDKATIVGYSQSLDMFFRKNPDITSNLWAKTVASLVSVHDTPLDLISLACLEMEARELEG